jgi:hypothetical protein
MAEIIRPTNFDPINVIEIAELSADALSGQKIVIPTNVSGIVDDDYLVIGSLAAENAELVQVDSVTGGSVTLTANLAIKHYRNERITKLFGNKINIYRATNVDGNLPDDTDFSLLGTVDIDVDQIYTSYTDLTGGDGYWYKKTYFNSTSTTETSLADATGVRGGGYGHYTSVDEVRMEAGLMNNRWIGDDLIYQKILSAESEINASLIIGSYTLPLADIPDQIKNATRLLAAGYLLTIDYGPEHNGTNKDGEKKISMAREILSQIENGNATLVNQQGVAVAKGQQVKSYPTDSEDTTEPRKFSMQDTW